MAFVTPVVEHWLEQEIAQWVHHEGSIRWPLLPWSYISLPVNNIQNTLMDRKEGNVLSTVCMYVCKNVSSLKTHVAELRFWNLWQDSGSGIWLVDMGFNGMLSDPHCRHIWPIGGTCFNWATFGLLNSLLRQIEMRTDFSFGLILRDIPNSITSQTNLRLLQIPVGLLILPCIRQCRWSPLTPSPFFFLSRNWQRLVPVPMTGVRYNSLLWMCTLNTLTWCDQTWPACFIQTVILSYRAVYVLTKHHINWFIYYW